MSIFAWVTQAADALAEANRRAAIDQVRAAEQARMAAARRAMDDSTVIEGTYTIIEEPAHATGEHLGTPRQHRLPKV